MLDFLSDFCTFLLIFRERLCYSDVEKTLKFQGFSAINPPDARQRISVATDQKVRGSNPLRRAKRNSSTFVGLFLFVFCG